MAIGASVVVLSIDRRLSEPPMLVEIRRIWFMRGSSEQPARRKRLKLGVSVDR